MMIKDPGGDGTEGSWAKLIKWLGQLTSHQSQAVTPAMTNTA